MTFFDIKLAIFVIKLASCKKCAKLTKVAHRALQLEFWKNLLWRAQ